MPDMQQSDVQQRPPTPEDRSNVRRSANPVASTPKFDVGNEAWIRPPKKGWCEIKIAARKIEDGKYWYQVKESNGDLYKKGEWVPQKKLEEAR